MLQVYEIEAVWEKLEVPEPKELNVIGLKMFYNVEVDELCSNFTDKGIDGISVEMNTPDGYGWFNFPRAQVLDFNLQNGVTFNYYKQLKFDNNKSKIHGLLLESRITDQIRDSEDLNCEIH